MQPDDFSEDTRQCAAGGLGGCDDVEEKLQILEQRSRIANNIIGESLNLL